MTEKMTLVEKRNKVEALRWNGKFEDVEAVASFLGEDIKELVIGKDRILSFTLGLSVYDVYEKESNYIEWSFSVRPGEYIVKDVANSLDRNLYGNVTLMTHSELFGDYEMEIFRETSPSENDIDIDSQLRVIQDSLSWIITGDLPNFEGIIGNEDTPILRKNLIFILDKIKKIRSKL